MGAPKQKWTQEEEAALKSGVVKHGAGKWRTILKDPEFSGVLYLRSNVDLKDKWRNMSVMANGWGSREKARLASKRMHQTAKDDDNSTTISSDFQSDEDTDDDKPATVSSGTLQNAGPKRSFTSGKLDNLIVEAITSLKDPGGSNKTTISSFIEEQYWAPPNFKRLLSAKLKFLTANGKLIKVKRKYRIAPTSSSGRRNAYVPLSEAKQRVSSKVETHDASVPLLEGRQRVSSKVEMGEIETLTKAQIDLELAKMRIMNAEEAAAAAARAVAEAEAAIAEAEEAAREAEIAEADAEAAKAFAEAARKTLKGRNPRNMMVRA